MKSLNILFFATFAIQAFCQTPDIQQVQSQIQNTDDVQQISDIIVKNNKLVEDNIKKFDESTRKKVTKVLLNAANETSVQVPDRNSTKSQKNPSIQESSGEHLEISTSTSMTMSLVVFTLIASF